jgi:hypothetical protein
MGRKKPAALATRERIALRPNRPPDDEDVPENRFPPVLNML